MSDSKIDLSNWVPKLLDIVSEFRPGSIPTAEQLNDYFNLLIEQGDYNSETIEAILSENGIVDLANSAIADIVKDLQAKIDAGYFNGPQGPVGEKGEAGPQGPVGPQGPKGEQGIQGEQGPAGVNGRDGLDGRDGRDAVILNITGNEYGFEVKDGHLYIVYTDGTDVPTFELNSDYHLLQKYTDDNGNILTNDLGNVRGPAGDIVNKDEFLNAFWNLVKDNEKVSLNEDEYKRVLSSTLADISSDTFTYSYLKSALNTDTLSKVMEFAYDFNIGNDANGNPIWINQISHNVKDTVDTDQFVTFSGNDFLFGTSENVCAADYMTYAYNSFNYVTQITKSDDATQHNTLSGTALSYALTVADDTDFTVKLCMNLSDILLLIAGTSNIHTITYNQCGANLDGVHDDRPFIEVAHRIANKYNLKVEQHTGTIVVACSGLIPIETDVNWSGCTFISYDYNRYGVFSLNAIEYAINNADVLKNINTEIATAKEHITSCEGLFRDYTLLAASTPEHTRKESDDATEEKEPNVDLVLQTHNGDIVYPVLFNNDYSVKAYEVPRETITIKGCNIKVNKKFASAQLLFMSITRSNVIIKDFTIIPTTATLRSTAYNGCVFKVDRAYNVTFSNILAVNINNDFAGYIIHVKSGLKITIQNSTMAGVWGAIGTTNVKELTIRDCLLNRIDNHNYCGNITVDNCIITNKGIVLGFGTGLVNINKCTFYPSSDWIVALRGEYSNPVKENDTTVNRIMYQGVISIKDCYIHNTSDTLTFASMNVNPVSSIYALATQPIMQPRISVDSIKLDVAVTNFIKLAQYNSDTITYTDSNVLYENIIEISSDLDIAESGKYALDAIENNEDIAGTLANRITETNKNITKSLATKADNIYYDENNSELQLKVGDKVLSTTTIKSVSGGSSGIALAQPTIVTVTSKNQAADIKWTDPEDLTYAGATLATWQKTVVVRKEGSAPASVNDGTIVVTTTERNKYAETAYTDSGLTNDVTYYYGIFPCSKAGVYTTTYTISVVPTALKIVTFADATDEEIKAMLEAHYNGTINIADYWSVGDMRTIHLDAMAATGVSESHVAQDQQFVIIGIEHDDLKTPINNHTKAAITIQPLRMLSNGITCESGYMNSSDTNKGGWEESARRKWCNNVFVNALPSSIQNLIKTVSKLNYKVYNSTNLTTTSDSAFLLSETEIFGAKQYSAGNTEGTQYEYYKTSSNRKKYQGNATTQGSATSWWERSPGSTAFGVFCVANSDSAGGRYASFASSLCPALCL